MTDRVSTDRARESGQGEMERRVPESDTTSDGSGAWGAEQEDRGLTDYANQQMWYGVAAAAETMGLTNAARHMRHYLDNSGTTLTVDADMMMRDVPALRAAYDAQLGEARAEVDRRVAAMSTTELGSGQTFQLEGQRRSDVYCDRSESADWYFAVGGFTYYYTAEVRVLPVQTMTEDQCLVPEAPQVEMSFRLQVRDRYNWDQGKAVTLAGITVRDEQLGRLHRVGLSQEYDVQGQTSLRMVRWASSGATAGASPEMSTGGRSDREAEAPEARSGAGGRADPTRSVR